MATSLFTSSMEFCSVDIEKFIRYYYQQNIIAKENVQFFKKVSRALAELEVTDAN